MAKKSYIAKTVIQHDGEDFSEGDTIELDDKKEAPQLLAVKAIEPLETGSTPEAKKATESKKAPAK